MPRYDDPRYDPRDPRDWAPEQRYARGDLDLDEGRFSTERRWNDRNGPVGEYGSYPTYSQGEGRFQHGRRAAERIPPEFVGPYHGGTRNEAWRGPNEGSHDPYEDRGYGETASGAMRPDARPYAERLARRDAEFYPERRRGWNRY